MRTDLETAITTSVATGTTQRDAMVAAAVVDAEANKPGLIVVANAAAAADVTAAFVAGCEAADLTITQQKPTIAVAQDADPGTTPVIWEVVHGSLPTRDLPTGRSVHIDHEVWEAKVQALLDCLPETT